MPKKGHKTASRQAQLHKKRKRGESRAQELRDKAPALAAHLHPPQWHFIGRLQRNKVKYVVRWASLIHTVDTIALATEIATRAPRPIGVLVQVNTGTDPAKGGVAPDQALTLCQQIDALDNIELCGLMTLPPWTDDPDGASPFFATLGRLAEAGRQHELPLHTLSMGMSRDFEGAIAHGATIIRLGTALFGPRPARPTI